MNDRGFLLSAFSVAGILSLPACTQAVPAEPAVRAEPQVSLGAPITTVKPGAAIGLSAEVPKDLSAGNTGTAFITLNEGYPSGTLTLTATAKSGLSLSGESETVEFDMASGATHTWRLTFATETDGVHYLNIMATADPKSGQPQSRAHSIRVEVGDWAAAKAKLDAQKSIETGPDGERVVILEAEETID